MTERDTKKKVGRLAFLGTLAGGLAHEVKNPLSTMSVNLQLLKEDWENPQTPKEQRTLKKVNVLMREVDRLESIVNDFLNFARGFSMTLAATDLNDLIGEMVEFLGPEAQKNGIRILTFLDPNLPKVNLDANYIQKALLNLFHNAFQALAAKEEGDREVMVRTLSVAEGVEVEITDTGPGMAEEMHEKVFQVFYSTKKGGTGMGLPTVRRIVEEHDGSVTLLSEKDKGTKFILFFPLNNPES